MKPIVLRDPEVDADNPPVKVDLKPTVPDAGAGKGTPANPDKSPKVRTPEEMEDASDAGHIEHKPKGDSNAAFAAMRVENKRLQDTVNQLQDKVQKVDGVLSRIGQVYGGEGEQTEIPIEERLVKDPIATIKLISKAAYQEVTSEARFSDTLGNSRKAVLERHPALRNPESPEYQAYNRICAENPDYFKLAKGPLLAMREMEEELKMYPAGNPNKEEHVQPQRQFVNVGGAPSNSVIMRGGGGDLGGAPTELTPAQAEYCRKFSIDPKIYLQVANKANKGGYSV